MRQSFCPPVLVALLSLTLAMPLRLHAQAPPPLTTPEVQALMDKGNLATKTFKNDEAIALYNLALDKARTLKDKMGEARTLYFLGNVYRGTGELPKALECYEQSLQIVRQMGYQPGEADAHNTIGIIYSMMGQPSKAMENFEQALVLYRKLKQITGEMQILNNMGIDYKNRGQFAKAIELFEQSVALCKKINDKNGEAETLGNIGVIYLATGEKLKALKIYEQILPLFQQAGNRRLEANTLGNLGNVYSDIGQSQKGLEYFQQALVLFREMRDRRNIASTLDHIGLVYCEMGQSLRALKYFEEALPVFVEIQDRGNQAYELCNIGSVYKDNNDPQKALLFLEKAIPLLRSAGDRQNLGTALTISGLAYRDLGQFPRALKRMEQALSLQKEIGIREQEALTHNSMGVLLVDMGQPQKALSHLEQSQALYNASGYRIGEAGALGNIANLLFQQGNLVRAESYYLRSIALIEAVRASLGGLSTSKTSFLASYLQIYQRYLALLLRSNKPAEAFELAQRMKARALLDLLYDGRVQIAQFLTPGEREREQELRRNADQINAAMVKESVENEIGAKLRFVALKKRLAKAENDLQSYTDTLYALHPELAKKRAARTLSLSDIARFLPEDTALLEYVVLKTPKGADLLDKTVLFVTTVKGGKAQVKAYTINITSASLSRQTAAFRQACADPRLSYRTLARKLYNLLLAPASRALVGKKRLVVCPDASLWDVPFQALLFPASKRRVTFVAERYEVVYGYSATGAQAALTAKHGKPTGSVLAMVNPEFGDAKRFGDNAELPGQRPLTDPSRPLTDPSRPLSDPSRPLTDPSRPLSDPSRPLTTPSRPLTTPSRPITTPSRPLTTPSRPITTPSRPLTTPSRPITTPSRPISDPSRPITTPSRDLFAQRGGKMLSLPGTQREGEEIKRLFPGAAIYSGNLAQEATTKQRASSFRYLHLASHAFFNDASPLLSSVVLAQPTDKSEDGYLTAREIFDLNLNAEMVVLSACNTARGEKRSGEGIVGLTWALFVAGAPTQVLSQWSVDDASTAKLMEGFYQRVKQGKAKGQSLREAGLSLMRGQDPKFKTRNVSWRHPYYWAPFVLIGDWR